MNFSYSEEQQAIFDLADQILKEGTPQERLLELERADGPRFDPALWAKLGEAGLRCRRPMTAAGSASSRSPA